MESMTFGTIPAFEEFETAFKAVDGLVDNTYHMSLITTDAYGLETAGLRTVDRCSSAGWNHQGKLDLLFTAAQLYRLIEGLVELHDIDSDEVYAEWAGSFASSIMATLGFEWI